MAVSISWKINFPFLIKFLLMVNVNEIGCFIDSNNLLISSFKAINSGLVALHFSIASGIILMASPINLTPALTFSKVLVLINSRAYFNFSISALPSPIHSLIELISMDELSVNPSATP